MIERHPLLEAASALTEGATVCPVWLVGGFYRLATGLTQSIVCDRDTPGRANLRRRLSEIGTLATLLTEALSDPVFQYLKLHPMARDDEEGWQHDEDGRVTLRFLSEIAARAGQITAAIPEGGGANKYYPRENGVDPFHLCARMVVVAWNETHHRPPAVDEKQPRFVCRALWRAAGFEQERAHGRNGNGWRNHIQKVLPFKDDQFDQTIRRAFNPALPRLPRPRGDLRQATNDVSCAG